MAGSFRQRDKRRRQVLLPGALFPCVSLATMTAVGLVLTAQQAIAQQIPDPAQPGRIEQDLRLPDDRLDRLPPEVEVPEERPRAPADDGATFVLRDIEILGTTVVDARRLRPLFANRIGTRVSLGDLQEIADALTEALRREGFLITRVVLPAQSIRDGRVRMTVLEGYVSDVRVESESIDSGDHRVRSFAEKVMASRPLRSVDLERYLLLLNDLPGLTVRSVLTPSEQATGASTLILRIEKQGLTASFSADNRGSTYIGPVQFGTSLGVNGVAGDHDRLSARYIRSSDFEELEYIELSYRRPLNSEGTTFDISGLLSRSEPGDSVDILDVKGRNRTITIGVTHPLIRSRDQNLFVSGQFTARDTKTRFFADTPDELLQSEDRIRVLQAGLSYDRTDDWNGVSLADLEISQGLNILWPRVTDSPDLSRSNGKSDFTKVTLELRRLQEIMDDLSLLVGVRGQYSFDSLLASEEFGYGGSDYGRGYDPSEITGDIGIAAKAELRYDLPLPQTLFGWRGVAEVLTGAQAFAYYDIGRVWLRDPTGGDPDSESGASTGGGLRFTLLDRLQTSLEVAKPLTRPVAAKDPGGSPRFLFSVVLSY